ncbi:ankyrin [Neocallimastix lanati (nom. inval.)]|nr:ankyrin [Neocallimastix sp. JGI-2020a]
MMVKHHLFIACESGNETIVKYLVEHDANVNKESNYGETPLLSAFHTVFDVQFYNKHKTNKNKKLKYRNTKIYNKYVPVNETIVRYLVDQGANVNKENNKGETPLFNANKYGNETIEKYLVDHGAVTYKNRNAIRYP